MEQLKLNKELKPFNNLIPMINVVTAEEAKALLKTNFTIPMVVDEHGTDHNVIFLHALAAYMSKNVSKHVRWSDHFMKKYNVIKEFTGKWYPTTYNKCYADKGEDPTNEMKAENVLDFGSYVNADLLLSMQLLPTLVGDIVSKIGIDLSGFDMTEGYNKKLGMCIGNWEQVPSGNNLIIIDISGSIPRGIADNMLWLCSTMALKMRADVIITGSTSEFFENEKAIGLDATAVRERIGLGNESKDFNKIIRKKLDGKTYHNVVSFGDQDTLTLDEDSQDDEFLYDPRDYKPSKIKGVSLKVGKVIHYHTQKENTPTGYGIWAEQFADNVEYNKPNEWCHMFR